MRAGGGRYNLPQLDSTAAKLAVALVVASVIYALAVRGTPFGQLLLLTPADVFGLQLWQPFTYAFIATNPLGVIFGALILWSIGGPLEAGWGARRLLLFAIGSTVLAGVLTVLLALALPGLRLMTFAGGTVMTTTIWVAYGLSLGGRQTNFWGMPITGNVFALIGVGFVVLNALFSPVGLYGVMAELFGILIALAYSRDFTPRTLWLRLQSMRFRRQMKSRSAHLKLVGRDRNMPSDSDRFLH